LELGGEGKEGWGENIPSSSGDFMDGGGGGGGESGRRSTSPFFYKEEVAPGSVTEFDDLTATAGLRTPGGTLGTETSAAALRAWTSGRCFII
jgi:hypothetical protein